MRKEEKNGASQGTDTWRSPTFGDKRKRGSHKRMCKEFEK